MTEVQTQNLTEVQTRIKTFLSRFFRQHDLQPGEDIFALGFVNSLLAMQLVNFVRCHHRGRGPRPGELPHAGRDRRAG
jgi:hypothetical protein